MKRTRRWEYVKQDVIRLAALGMSADDIAKRLGLGRATVFRWKKQGKLDVDVRLPKGPIVVTKGETAAQWAASVRASYDLDATDDQIVAMAESVLIIARDPATPPSLRLAAFREFRGAVKQLALVARSEPNEKPEEAPSRKTFAVPKRSNVDPRALLLAVK